MRLFASVRGDDQKTEATRGGHKKLFAHVRGWRSGVAVLMQALGDTELTAISVTGGSDNPVASVCIATLETKPTAEGVQYRLLNADGRCLYAGLLRHEER